MREDGPANAAGLTPLQEEFASLLAAALLADIRENPPDFDDFEADGQFPSGTSPRPSRRGPDTPGRTPTEEAPCVV